MLGKTRLSSKLMFAVAPLVVVLVVSLFFAVGPRFERAAIARGSSELGALWTPLVDGLDAVSAEARGEGGATATDEAFVELGRQTSGVADAEPLTSAVERAAQSVSAARNAAALGDTIGFDLAMDRAEAQLLDIGDVMTALVDDATTSREFAALTRLSETAAQWSELEELVTRSLAGDAIDVVEFERVAQRSVDSVDAFRASAPEAWQARFDELDITDQIDAVTAQFTAMQDGSVEVAEVEMGVFVAPIDAVEALRAELAEVAVEDAASRSTSSMWVAALGIVLMVVSLALALGLLYRVGRSVTRRIELVSQRSNEVASEQLPTLVAALADPTGRTALPEVVPISNAGQDEIGELAESFNRVQSTLVDIAGQQMEVLGRGVSEIFVTLARRNSSLVDRQLVLLDDLEARAEDPDLLADYYELDHLATRMRRQAESLLVLARSETRRRRSTSVAVDVVVRAGISEIEDYRRVDVSTIDPIEIRGDVVADVSHVLAEILDNATSFSPPESRVDVSGALTDRGYELLVADSGIGVPADRIAELNEMLATPPVLGLAVDSALGLAVVSILAEKHEMTARIVPNESGGVSLHLVLPPSMLIAVPAQDRATPSDAPPPAPAMPSPATLEVAGTGSLNVPPAMPTSDDARPLMPLASPTASSLVADLPAPTLREAPRRLDGPSADDHDATSGSPRPMSVESGPSSLDEAIMSLSAPAESLPTRDPDDSIRAFVDDHSRSSTAMQPTELGDALMQLAESVGRVSDQAPRLPDNEQNSLDLPTRRPGENFTNSNDDRPIVRRTSDPEALRARLAAFSEGISGSGGGTLVEATQSPNEGNDS